MRRLITIFYFLAFSSLLKGQEIVFPLNEYLKIVKTAHPMIFQGRLLIDQGEAQKLKARGNFDPKVSIDYASKTFDNTNYYQPLNANLKLPIWWGPEVKLAYENNDGAFINNDQKLPPSGLISAGIEMPLLQGLKFDKRRMEVLKSDLYQKANEIEQLRLYNDLLYAATEAYFEWQFRYTILTTVREITVISKNNLDIVKAGFTSGDRPAIDTLEAYVNWQSFIEQQIESEQAFINAEIDLNNYLWQDGFIPMELQDGRIPEEMDGSILFSQLSQINVNLNQWINNHPQLLLNQNKQSMIDLDIRLRKELTKPVLNVNYNPLFSFENFNDVFITDNFKFGLQFGVPIRNRKARAELQLAKLDARENEYEFELKNLSIQNKIQIGLQSELAFNEQKTILGENLIRYEQLLNVEQIKFRLGESSVFFLNQRQLKLLKANQDFIKIQIKQLKNRAKLWFLIVRGEAI